MTTFWWDYIAMYPKETAIIITVIIVGYLAYVELSKFWNKPLFITDYGRWRIYRYIGRITKMEGQKYFVAQSPKFRQDPNLENTDFCCKIKIRYQPTRDIILESKDIAEITSRKIVLNKKYMLWNTEDRAYRLTNNIPRAYHLNPQNLERFMLYKIDTIDQRANKAAVASPPVIHHSLLQQHLPLEFGQYEESVDDRILDTPEYLFDTKDVGEYGTFNDLPERELKRRERRFPIKQLDKPNKPDGGGR
jgi:hypothetical protein